MNKQIDVVNLKYIQTLKDRSFKILFKYVAINPFVVHRSARRETCQLKIPEDVNTRQLMRSSSEEIIRPKDRIPKEYM